METFWDKCFRYDFEKLFKRKGYAYFTNGRYNLNIIGVRRKVHDNEITDKFDDYLVLIYKTQNREVRRLYSITTEPGYYYMVKQLLNKKGTAILVPGQYRGCWQIGKHKGKYKALVQVKPVKVYRDANKDKVYNMNPKTIDTGVFGINIHRSKEFGSSDKIDRWSAGCQVFKIAEEFKSFMKICEEQSKLYGNSFTYTLINEEDMV